MRRGLNPSKAGCFQVGEWGANEGRMIKKNFVPRLLRPVVLNERQMQKLMGGVMAFWPISEKEIVTSEGQIFHHGSTIIGVQRAYDCP